MGQPIILDGGAQMITIQLPDTFKQEGGNFSVSPNPETEPFQSIVISDSKTGKPFFQRSISGGIQWKIEIK